MLKDQLGRDPHRSKNYVPNPDKVGYLKDDADGKKYERSTID